VSTPPVEQAPEEGQQQQTEQPAPPQEKGEDLGEYQGMVSARLRSFTAKSPELAAALAKDPNLKNALEGTFRRDAAYRELFPTVAEARQFREMLPNGMEDLRELMSTVQEIEQLDGGLDDKGPDGAYIGHPKIIRDIWANSKEAAPALMETALREWPREDRESYNRIMGEVVGASLVASNVPFYMEQLGRAAEASKDPNLINLVADLAARLGGFMQDQGGRQPTAEEQRLRAQREQFNRERQDNDKRTLGEFNSTLGQQTRQMHSEIIGNHDLIKRLPSTMPAKDRADLITEIGRRLHTAMNANQAFVRKFNALHAARNGKGCLDLARNVASQPWMLNRFVRQVLMEKNASLVSSRNGAPAQRSTQPAPRVNGQPAKPTKPYQIGKQWYHADGRRMDAAEVLSGRHLGA
jgi:hypothetical protein